MSIGRLVTNLILSTYEARYCRRLVEQRNSKDLVNLMAFLVRYNRRFPFHYPYVKETLFSITNWELSPNLQNKLATDFGDFLFHNVESSHKTDWNNWIRLCRTSRYSIHVMNPSVSEAVWRALCAGKLDDLATADYAEDYEYLLGYYRLGCHEILKKAGLEQQRDIFPVLVEYAYRHYESGFPDGAVKWILSKCETRLQDRFLRRKDNWSLTNFVIFLVNHGRPFPINAGDIRHSLFCVSSWSMPEEKYQNALFSSVEHYLFHNVESSQPKEWRVWLRSCREIRRYVDVRSPNIAEAFSRARSLNRFANDPTGDHNYLLGWFLQAYEAFQEMEVEDRREVVRQLWASGPIGHPDQVPEWILSTYEEIILYRRLIEQHDSQSLRDLIAFLLKHGRSLRFPSPDIGDALLKISSWQMPTVYHQDKLLLDIEAHVLSSPESSRPSEWCVWLRLSRELDHNVDVKNSNLAQALKDARDAGKFTDLPRDDYDYLLKCYDQAYEIFQEIEPDDDRGVILNQLWLYGPIDEPDKIEQWILGAYEELLCRYLINNEDNRSLNRLLVFLIKYNRSLPVQREEVRNALFSIDLWEVPEEYRSHFFFWVEDYLLDNTHPTQPAEWSVWLRSSRHLNHRIDAMDPEVSEAVWNAYHNHKLHELDGLRREDHEYLLRHYLRAWQRLFEDEEIDQQNLAPMLLAFGTLAHRLGLDKDSERILRHWSQHKRLRPRALTALSDEQASKAPIYGVGSPHGVRITIYYDRSKSPVRISCAGSTGDATLNSQLLTGLFAQALVCDSEPTLLTSSGCTLNLELKDQESGIHSYANLLHTAVRWDGPTEPTPDMPTLGMDDKQAVMALRFELFRDLEDFTGLVRVEDNWPIDEAKRFESQITQALRSRAGNFHVIRSNPDQAVHPGVIHVMPLLHRDSAGKIVPIEVELPYQLLDSETIWELLCTARRRYMEQLISEGQYRRDVAEREWAKESWLVQRWKDLSKEEQNKECEQRPYIRTELEYRPDLGAFIPLDPPQEWEHRFYEDEMRPILRNSLKEAAERFDALCRRLQEMNGEGGKADILTLKLLVDSMIRQAPLPTAHSEAFLAEYRNWVELTSALAWAAIENWAVERGLPPETLAADNILFNTELDAKEQRIFIQPMVMVDLHDFLIRVDCQKGLMEVVPGDKTPSLGATLLPDGTNRITDLRSLHNHFIARAAKVPWLRDAKEQREDTVESRIESRISSDEKLSALISLQQAKHLLLKGDTDQAVKILDEIRESDLAPIYFWGAVGHQCQLLNRSPTLVDRILREQYGHSLKEFGKDKIKSLIVKISIWTLREYLRDPEDARLVPAESGVRYEPESPLDDTRVWISIEADKFLEGLKAEDSSFVQGLVNEHSEERLWKKIAELEKNSIGPSLYDAKRSAIYALSSHEFIRLAEIMKQTAKSLPFEGHLTEDVKEVVQTIVEQLHALSFQDSWATERVENLLELFKKTYYPGRHARK